VAQFMHRHQTVADHVSDQVRSGDDADDRSMCFRPKPKPRTRPMKRGILTATLLSMLVIPAAYLLLRRRRAPAALIGNSG
jgi:hypothetical protein